MLTFTHVCFVAFRFFINILDNTSGTSVHIYYMMHYSYVRYIGGTCAGNRVYSYSYQMGVSKVLSNKKKACLL